MIHFFSGCASITSFFSVTLVFGVISTAVQSTGEEASLFTSASIFAYSAFLCYPPGECLGRMSRVSLINLSDQRSSYFSVYHFEQGYRFYFGTYVYILSNNPDGDCNYIGNCHHFNFDPMGGIIRNST